MNNETRRVLGFYVFCAVIVLFMFGSFYVFDFMKNITREYDVVVWNGEVYTFPKDIRGYGYNPPVNIAFGKANRKVKVDVFGIGPDFIWAKLNSFDVSGSGAFIREGKDSQDNFVIGLFVDKEFFIDPTFYKVKTGNIEYFKPGLTNKSGDTTLLDVGHLKGSESHPYFDFDPEAWRKLVLEHYIKVIAEARAAQ